MLRLILAGAVIAVVYFHSPLRRADQDTEAAARYVKKLGSGLDVDAAAVLGASALPTLARTGLSHVQRRHGGTEPKAAASP